MENNVTDEEKLENLKLIREIDSIKVDQWFRGFVIGLLTSTFTFLLVGWYTTSKKIEAFQEQMEFRAIEAEVGRYVLEDGQKVFKFIGE